MASLLGCMRCAPVCDVDCERRIACSVGVSVRLLYGDLFLFGGLNAKGCSQWFELEGGFVHLLREGGLELSKLGT